MTTLPLTVLAFEGPSVRMYLHRLFQSGFQVERVLTLVIERRRSTGKRLYPFLPEGFRRPLILAHQNSSYHYWPRYLFRNYPALVAKMIEQFSIVTPNSEELFETVVSEEFDYSQYSPCVESVWIENFSDPRLKDALEGLGNASVLFTGGGLLPKSVVDLPQIQFIHVHPGLLPHIKGADGLLWSVLLRGRAGASCFFMNSGLDTGELVDCTQYPRFRFETGETAIPDLMLYRCLFSFYDPLIRAELLASIFSRWSDPNQFSKRVQDKNHGQTYHFMNPKLRKIALERIFG